MIKAYASYFVSYLLMNLKEELNDIGWVILFGSAAKDEATKESDIDLFIVLKKKNRSLEKKIERTLNEYYKSREALLFKVKGIDNKINLIIGRLEEWGDLRVSIESTGIVFYGRYVPYKIEGKKYTIFFWDNIKRNRGAFLNKIYGFKSKDKKYTGLLEKYGGKKLGKSTIMVPMEYRDDILKTQKYYGVNSKIIEVYVDLR